MRTEHALLDLQSVTKRFGGIVAVDRLSFSLAEGEIVGLIGPNGSGKTVTVNLCSGIYPPDEGHIWFCGRLINGLPPWEIYKLGLARTFQVVRLWPQMTVLENIMVGPGNVLHLPPLTRWLSIFKPNIIEKKIYNKAMQALEIVGMSAFAEKRAGELSFGQQRLVELARLISSNPRCALLDEPAAGLKPELVDQLAKLLVHWNRELRTAFLVVEHRTRLVMEVSSRVVVLNYGQKIAEGAPEDIIENEEVIAAYLGKPKGAS